MANICTNHFRVHSNKKGTIAKVFDFLGDNFDMGVEAIDANYISGIFFSRWIFPETLMRELTDELQDDDTLYIEVNSLEHGDGYECYAEYKVQPHIGGGWYISENQ